MFFDKILKNTTYFHYKNYHNQGISQVLNLLFFRLFTLNTSYAVL